MESQVCDQGFQAVDIHIIGGSGQQRSILLAWAAEDLLQLAQEFLAAGRGRRPLAKFHDIALFPLSAAAQIPDGLAGQGLDDTPGIDCVDLHGTTWFLKC